MLRILLVAPAALIAWVGAAAASDCLNVVDGFSVDYDLPAASSLADASTAAADRQVLTAKPIEGQDTIERTTPPGRPGLARLTSPGPAPVFTERSKLTPEQSRQVQELLHRARSAEALGNEDECMAAFNQAQKVVASPPATPAKPRNHAK
ncbi:MAG: hypothetical protein JWL84_69 [Rhodospirillales bacterium]|jgi:hypothetical protein|nr:hypothetical protein [Rhodospirillales bacterium]